jgi:tetratricopeptide (TPR) repeat protein
MGRRNFCSPLRRRIGAWTAVAWLSSVLFAIAPALCAQTPDNIQKQLKEALDLYDKGRYLETLPLFQHLDEIHPNDPIVKAHVGFALIALSVTKSDAQERTQLRVRARKFLLDAQALGDKSNLVRVLLDGIPEDGTVAPFSSRKDVEDAMREGETAFANADLDSAIAAYQRALLLDSNQYGAALFTGDAYFRKKETDKAGEWFSRAISINPNSETAYRYWADALAQSGKNADAIEKYIDAIVAEPYKRQSWVGLIQFPQHVQVTLTQPHIVSPNSLKSEGNKTNITIDPSTLDKKDGGSSWIMYEMSRSLWRGDKFNKEFPDEKQYRHTLKEEAEALDLVAAGVAEQQKDHKIQNLDPTLATLLKLKQDGLIEAYVLISAPDDGIVKDYEAYRSAHRELIHRYIAEYIASPLRKKP